MSANDQGVQIDDRSDRIAVFDEIADLDVDLIDNAAKRRADIGVVDIQARRFQARLGGFPIGLVFGQGHARAERFSPQACARFMGQAKPLFGGLGFRQFGLAILHGERQDIGSFGDGTAFLQNYGIDPTIRSSAKPHLAIRFGLAEQNQFPGMGFRDNIPDSDRRWALDNRRPRSSRLGPPCEWARRTVRSLSKQKPIKKCSRREDTIFSYNFTSARRRRYPNIVCLLFEVGAGQNI